MAKCQIASEISATIRYNCFFFFLLLLVTVKFSHECIPHGIQTCGVHTQGYLKPELLGSTFLCSLSSKGGMYLSGFLINTTHHLVGTLWNQVSLEWCHVVVVLSTRWIPHPQPMHLLIKPALNVTEKGCCSCMDICNGVRGGKFILAFAVLAPGPTGSIAISSGREGTTEATVTGWTTSLDSWLLRRFLGGGVLYSLPLCMLHLLQH